MTQYQTAKFAIGQVVRHREQTFTGIVVDADAVYAGPRDQPLPTHPGQPFYAVYASGAEGGMLLYVGEDVLETDPAGALGQRDAEAWFTTDARGHHAPRSQQIH